MTDPADHITSLADRWLIAARVRDWERMLDMAQITWKSKKSVQGNLDTLQAFFGEHKIKRWKTGEVTRVSGVMYIVTALIFTAAGTFHMKANAICEKAPYKSDPNGTWGINPISAILKKAK